MAIHKNKSDFPTKSYRRTDHAEVRDVKASLKLPIDRVKTPEELELEEAIEASKARYRLSAGKEWVNVKLRRETLEVIKMLTATEMMLTGNYRPATLNMVVERLLIMAEPQIAAGMPLGLVPGGDA